MPKLQRYLTKDRDISGRKATYYNYRITMPADIVNTTHIAEGQVLHASISRDRKCITVQQTPHADSRPMKARLRLTRHYQGIPCFVTEIILPIEFVRELNFEKGQNIDFTIHTDNTISLR